MYMQISASIVAVLIWIPGVLAAQFEVQELPNVLGSGDVTLVSAIGRGLSSGAAIKGVLRNETASERKISTAFSVPLYLRNSGSGQNMLATGVYYPDGGYYSDGQQSFITLAPQQQAEVLFIAYCIEFEKDNPAVTDVFSIDDIPEHLYDAFVEITRYANSGPAAEKTPAIQAAIWLLQGETKSSINERFELTPEDQDLARRILGQVE